VDVWRRGEDGMRVRAIREREYGDRFFSWGRRRWEGERMDEEGNKGQSHEAGERFCERN